jgi:hypothetical protein
MAEADFPTLRFANYFLKLPLCRTCAAKLLPQFLQSFLLKPKDKFFDA